MEDTPLAPVNVYGRAKVEGERLVLEVRDAGLRTAVVRLSNVYGSVHDHIDRVIPAFVWAALKGENLRVDGLEQTLDFTYIDDVVCGLIAAIELLDNETTSPPPLHLLTGIPTTLGDLAELVIEQSGSTAEIMEAEPRSFDVSHFYGNPERAQSILGWKALVPLREGLNRLIKEFQTVVSNNKKDGKTRNNINLSPHLGDFL